MSLTVRNLYDNGLTLLGIYDPDYAPQPARYQMMDAINAALQLMQMAGEDFYAREILDVSLVAGTNMYSIAEAVQQVLDPARLSGGRILMPLATRSELDNFGPLFLGQINAPALGEPLAFFVETLRDDSSADATSINLWVVPTPAANDTLTLNVINDPPHYTMADLCSDPSPTPPVPHKYHESVLLPLVRMNVTTSDLYRRNNGGYPQIERDYQRALTLLGLADPRPKNPYKVNDELRAQAQPRTPQQ